MNKRFNNKVPSDLHDHADSIVRSDREPEDMDLASEATNDGTPAKSLAPSGKAVPRASGGPGVPTSKGSGGKSSR